MQKLLVIRVSLCIVSGCKAFCRNMKGHPSIHYNLWLVEGTFFLQLPLEGVVVHISKNTEGFIWPETFVWAIGSYEIHCVCIENITKCLNIMPTSNLLILEVLSWSLPSLVKCWKIKGCILWRTELILMSDAMLQSQRVYYTPMRIPRIQTPISYSLYLVGLMCWSIRCIAYSFIWKSDLKAWPKPSSIHQCFFRRPLNYRWNLLLAREISGSSS